MKITALRHDYSSCYLVSEQACLARRTIQAGGARTLTVTLAVMGGAQQNQPVVQEKKEYQA